MTIAEITSSLKKLSRLEKLEIIKFLANELAQEENTDKLENGQTYEIWSPYDAFSAEETLTKMLNEHKTKLIVTFLLTL